VPDPRAPIGAKAIALSARRELLYERAFNAPRQLMRGKEEWHALE
jgi:hypothetical protein